MHLKKNLLKFLVSTPLLGCASPSYMSYQRSEYDLVKSVDLVVSTSPDFGQDDLRQVSSQAGASTVELTSSFIIQNVGQEAHHFDFALAKANIRGLSAPLRCSDSLGNKERSSIGPGEKAMFRCFLIVNENQLTRADSWVNFSIPSDSSGVITSKKLIRLEDFIQ